MNDKNDFDMPSDEDELYDDALDENFEFDDEDELYDDLDLDSELDDAVSDEDQEDDWEDMATSPSNNKTKFGLSFNTMVIMGAVVIGVFVIMAQVNKEKAAIEVENPTDVSMPTALQMEGSFAGPGGIDKQKEEENTAALAEKEKTNKGFLFDTNILDAPQDIMTDAPPMPSPIISEQNEIIEKQTNVGTQNISQKPDNATPVPKTPNNTDIPIVQNEEVTHEAQNTEQDSVDKDMGSQIIASQNTQNMQANLDNTTQDADPKKIIAQKETSPSLEQKLDYILQRLEAMEHKMSTIEDMNNNQLQTITADIENSKQKKNIVLQSKQSTPVKQKTKKPAVKKTITWELRAAQPDKAWVSRKGQSSMHPIVVGDKLAGIGRIQSISYVKGRWIVQGSIGKIKQ